MRSPLLGKRYAAGPLLLFALLAAVVAMPSGAAASSLLDTRVSAGDAEKRRCHDGLARGEGVVRRTVTIARSSLVRARLRARGGDWDLAIFQARDRRLVGGAAGFRSRELAEGFADAGRLIVQACRRTGRSPVASLDVSAVPLPGRPRGGKRRVARLVEVEAPSQPERTRLANLGLDVTEHGDPGHLDVVLYDDADERKLRAAGFDFKVEIADLALLDFKNRRADAAYAQRTRKSSLPSGRDEYRHLVDYEADLKALVERNPGLVKPIVLPLPSLEGRPIHGVEITENVNAEDGKPVFLQMGIHHAREWPSAEMPMEFATMLVDDFGSDPRITNLVKRVRTIVVPVINPDGFNLSREASIDLQPLGNADPYAAALYRLLVDPAYDDPTAGLIDQIGTNPGHTAVLLADQQISFAYKRRNCRITDGQAPAPGECADQANRMLGTDPNRNYGGFWGGPGADPSPDGDTYRGAAPFSEPEVENVRRVVSSRQVTTLITNHTFSNLVLRPPGIAAEGQTPDEDIYKALGDAMGHATGYKSQYGYELYDTTGTTEDWSYYQSGGLGYTFEIGPNEFHPPFEQVVAEWEGSPSTPVDQPPFAPAKHGGNREAYLLAMESAANPGHHSVISGSAPPGARLEVARTSQFMTSPVVDAEGNIGSPQTLTDQMGSTMTVPESGSFEWHLNPSTRPYAKRDRLLIEPGPTPTSSRPISGGPATERIPIEIGAGDAALRAFVDVGDLSDYDLYLYDSGGNQVASGTPGGFIGVDEALTATGLAPGTYELEVHNFAAAEPWTGVIEKFPAGATFGFPATTESWSLTCRSADGAVLGTRTVTVERGQRAALGDVCTPEASSPAMLDATGGDRLRLGLRARRPSLRTLGRRGMRVRVSCSRICRSTVRLRVDNRTARRLGLTRRRSGSVTIARASLRRVSSRRAKVVTLRVSRRTAARLRRARSARMTLTGTAHGLSDRTARARATVRFRARR